MVHREFWLEAQLVPWRNKVESSLALSMKPPRRIRGLGDLWNSTRTRPDQTMLLVQSGRQRVFDQKEAPAYRRAHDVVF